jgi:hypothetical protein
MLLRHENGRAKVTREWALTTKNRGSPRSEITFNLTFARKDRRFQPLLQNMG